MNDTFHIKTHVHFGAIIYISCFKDYTNFYLCSSGMTFKTLLSISQNQGPIDPSMYLFTVTPIIKFQSQQFLQRILQNRYTQDPQAIQYDETKTKIFIDQFEFQLKQNNKMKEQQLKYPIKYNQSFMLQHKFSSKYLCFVKDSQTNQYTLQLSDIPTHNCIFSLKACFNYQKDVNTYVPFNSAAFLAAKLNDGLQVRQLRINLVTNSVFDPWVLSQQGQQKIKFNLFQDGEEVEFKNICYGDSVWIFHLESGSFVKIMQQQLAERNVLLDKVKYKLGYLKEKNENKDEQNARIVIQKSDNQLSAQKFGLWKIISATSRSKGNQRFKGGRVKYDQEVRFYNVRYDSFLGVRKIKLGRNHYEYVFGVEQSQQQNTVFSIKTLSSSSQYVTTEDLFLIKNLLTNTYLTLTTPMKINETSAILTPSADYRKQDNFKLTKIDFLQEWQNNYILSILPFLNEGIHELKATHQGYVTNKQQVMLKLLSENLIEMLTFSYDLTEGFQASESKLGKMTYNHYLIQKLLREQGIITKLIQILDIINASHILKGYENNNNKDNDNLKMMGLANIVKKFSVGIKEGDKRQFKLQENLLRKIVDTSFKVLRNCCKSNIQNSLITFQSIKIFIKYLALGTYAENFMMEAFHNMQILQKIGSRQFQMIFDQYMKMNKITKKYQSKIFQLFTKFIKIDGTSISKNQLEVYRLMQMDHSLMIPIRQADNAFIIIYNGIEIEINQFCQTNPEVCRFIADQIRFYAVLSADRNYVCSKTIKNIFPIATVNNYINKVDTPQKLKQSFLWILMDCYLNQRPRFKQQINRIFQIPKTQDNQNLQQLPQFQKQINMMKSQGMPQQSIDDIISCIHQADSMNSLYLNQLKQNIVKQIQRITIEKNNNNLYSSKTQTYLICLKYLIELSVFRKEQSVEVQKLIAKIVENIVDSLVVVSEKKFQLESKNFRELLLEMVEKNVIKKFDFSVKYDGIEDEVKEDNLCSIFINYSFYQNILLQQKDPRKRKQTDSVIKVLLELVGIYSSIVKGQKFKIFMQQIMKRQQIEKRSTDRAQFIQEVVIGRVLQFNNNQIDKMFTLLVLLFYNSNSYEINYLTINKLLHEIFADRLSLMNLNKIIFVVDEKQRTEHHEISKLYKGIKLLSETSQIWLNVHQAQNNYTSKYDSVILLFMNKIKAIIKIIMPGFDQTQRDPLSCIKFSKTIKSQKQIILSNKNVQRQILQFLSNYRHLVQVVKNGSNKCNRLLRQLFKCCYLFLYVFIYECAENKMKIHNIMKQFYLRNFTKDLSKVDLGQTIVIIEYLKNNYEECIEFFSKNPQIFQINHKYTAMHSQLLLKMLVFYDEPITINLKKFFISIFDYTSFKKFLWLNKAGNQLQIDIDNYLQSDHEPLIYHINALNAILLILQYVPQSKNAIKSHIRKSLSQSYLFQLLKIDDFYTKQNSNRPTLKLAVHFKQKIMRVIQFVYLSDEIRDDGLFFYELKRQNQLLNKLIEEAPARRQNQDFRKIMLMRQLRSQAQGSIDKKIQDIYSMNFLNCNILQIYLNSIDKFSTAYRYAIKNSQDKKLQQIGYACQDIHKKIISIFDILHRNPIQNKEQNYPIPNDWLFSINASQRDEDSLTRKKYTSSLIIQSIFNKKIYEKITKNQAQTSQNFIKILKSANLKQFLFLRKLSEFFEDAFQKLSNSGNDQTYLCLKMLIQFITLWIHETPDDSVHQLRIQIGKSQLIFPILNFFETCKLDKANKQLFLECLNFFNQLIGIEGNKNIQAIFNQYFTNKADSIQFFMKIKQLFDEINFQDRANYKCKKIYDSIEAFSRESQLRKQSQFILLNFLIYLCKGKYRQNQIFLSSLSNASNFNIMSGIWEILKYQSQKYKKNLINVENYDLITQCFATINQLVKGPCIQNQNQFLKRDFFLTVLDYFQFQQKISDLTLQRSVQTKLAQIQKISPFFTDNLKIYLNSDKITYYWMPSQVKYICISLICSLLSENQNEEGKAQLFTFPPDLIVRELDKVYERYIDLELEYNYANMEAKNRQEVVLPLGYKLYELLQYYPPEKIPSGSPGLQFFRKKSRLVQVLHGENLCIVVFPHIPDEISEAFKTQFLQEVDRSSVNSKLRTLQDTQIQQRQSDYPYGYLLLLTVLILTVIDIILYNQADGVPFVQYFNFLPILRVYGYDPTLDGIASALLVLGIVLSIIFFTLQIRGAVYFKQKFMDQVTRQCKLWDKIKNIMHFVWENLNQFHYIFTLLLCLLAAFNPFFDAILLLLELYRRSQTFSAIIKAISSTLDQLCVVLLMTLVCTYVLTAIIYYYSASELFPAECQTLYYCFVFSFDNGFRADAGIVGYADDEETILEDYVTEKFEKVFLNFVYLFIIKVIIDQIIGAIMVDKFAEIRQAKQKIEEDQNSKCFICGLSRNQLDREENGFEIHKENYHNVWNYFQFLAYLRKSKPQNLSGIQLYVDEQQKFGRLNWFPVGRSWHLEHKNKQNYESQKLEQSKIQQITKLFDFQMQSLNTQITQIWQLLNVKIAKEKSQKNVNPKLKNQQQ